jgi:hypothetical protein
MTTDSDTTAGNQAQELPFDPEPKSVPDATIITAMQTAEDYERTLENPENTVPIILAEALRTTIGDAIQAETTSDNSIEPVYIEYTVDPVGNPTVGMLYIDIPLENPLNVDSIEEYITNIAKSCELTPNISGEIPADQSKGGIESKRITFEIRDSGMFEALFDTIYNMNRND